MAKFKVNSNQFLVLFSGSEIANHYYTSIRLEVKGCATKSSNLLYWQGELYYGTPCYLPESKTARKFLAEYVKGKGFRSKLMRRINASYRFETKEKRNLLFNNMIVKLNHLIDNSFI